MSERDIEKLVADHVALQSENTVYAGARTAPARGFDRTLPD